MDYEILPHIGAGPIRFGMTMDEVRQAVGEPPRVFRKAKDSTCTTDSFSKCIHVFYRTPGVCTAVEFYEPARPFLGDRLFAGRPYAEVAEWLMQQDPNPDVDGAGLISRQLGMSLYAPGHLEDPNEPIEAVLVFEDGYYERDYRV